MCFIYRSDNIKMKKEEEEYSHRDQFNSILVDMHHSRFMKLLELINLSMNNISVVLYVDDVSFTKFIFKNSAIPLINNQYFISKD